MLESSAFYSRKLLSVPCHFTRDSYRAIISRRQSLTCSDCEILRTIARSEASFADVLKKGDFFPPTGILLPVVKSPIIRPDVSADGGSSEIIPEIRTEIPWRCNREKLEGELRNFARNEVQFLSLRRLDCRIVVFNFRFAPSPLLVTAKASGLSRTVAVSQNVSTGER